jgi:hypothetical protein
MALAGRRFAYGRGGFPGATSDRGGTTHARFGSEVEWKASNLVALLSAERSLIGLRVGTCAGNGGNRLKLADQLRTRAS